jgi:hypothetical protein
VTWILKWPKDGAYLTNADADLPEWSMLQRKAHRFATLAAARRHRDTWDNWSAKPRVVRLVPRKAPPLRSRAAGRAR